MSNLVQALQEQVSRLRAQLEEAREQIRQLREMLRPPNVTRYRELDLTGTEQAVLQIVLAAQGVCSNERLFEGLYGSRCETSQPGPGILSIYIFRLRRKLGAHGIQIDRVRGMGLFMRPDSKKRLRALALDSDEASQKEPTPPFCGEGLERL